MYLAYSLLALVVFIVVSPYFLYQAIRHKKYIGSLRQRLGFLPITFNIDAEESIWIHAVSVGERLADRHGVDPDRFLRVDVERDRQEAEALAEAADVLLVPDGLVQEIRRHDDEDDERQQAVGEIHRGGLL